MALTKHTSLYEILIRLHDGEVQGAHVIDREVVKDGDEILSDREGSPRGITLAEVGTLLGAESASMLEARDTMIAAHAAALAAKDAEHAEAIAAKDEQTATTAASHAAQVEATNTAHAEVIATMQAEHAAQIAAMQPQEAEPPIDEAGFAVLSPIQIRLALLGAGITSAMMDAAIAAIPDAVEKESASYYWEYSREYHRDHPLIEKFSEVLGIPEAQVDALWTQAATL